jgi:hypothetical protein
VHRYRSLEQHDGERGADETEGERKDRQHQHARRRGEVAERGARRIVARLAALVPVLIVLASAIFATNQDGKDGGEPEGHEDGECFEQRRLLL